MDAKVFLWDCKLNSDLGTVDMHLHRKVLQHSLEEMTCPLAHDIVGDKEQKEINADEG